MTNLLSFMSANFVARELGYQMTRGWGEGDQATQAAFRPIETFAARFDALLHEIRAAGFDAMDLWTGHLNPAWATDEHLAAAQAALAHHGLVVCSLAGWFGSTRGEFERACQIAVALGCPALGGATSLADDDRAWVVETLQRYGLRLGLENHPESDPAQILERIGDGGGGAIGTTVDTGWYATQGADAAAAIERLAGHLVVMHLKDVLPGSEHQTCRFGEGIVPLRACVEALRRVGYTGPIAIEHEPEHSDPTEIVKANAALLRGWLAEAEGAPHG